MTRVDRRAAALVALATLVLYAPTLDDYFLQDDFGVVWLMSQRTLSHVPGWFVGSWMENIWGAVPDELRPFPAMTFQPANWLNPGSPVPHHVTTLAFHVGTALLVVAIAGAAARLSAVGAAYAGLVFALLPNQTETAAWITGRVDSVPAFFYAASFLAYVRWRGHRGLAEGLTPDRPGRRRLYVWSLVWCFVALFSKQTGITIVVTLALYDALIAGWPPREGGTTQTAWTWLRPYVPFVLLTAAYLLLRYIVFSDVVRESLLTSERLAAFPREVGIHLSRIAAGTTGLAGGSGRVALFSALLLAVLWVAGRHRRTSTPAGDAGRLLFFAVLWTAVGLAPTLVAGYSSPRHAYQASIGWALALGLLLDRASEHRRWTRRLAFAAAAVLLASYIVQLRASLDDWRARAVVSERAVRDLEEYARMAPAGTLILTGVSARSWDYALPFAAKPPFTRDDLTRRVSVVGPADLSCCPEYAWEAEARRALRGWAAHPDTPPVAGLYWSDDDGEPRLLTDADEPQMRALVMLLLGTTNWAGLDGNLKRLLTDFVAVHPNARGIPRGRP